MRAGGRGELQLIERMRLRAEGLDAIMEQMAAQGHRPPPPASETVIEGLPRVRLDAAALSEQCGWAGSAARRLIGK